MTLEYVLVESSFIYRHRTLNVLFFLSRLIQIKHGNEFTLLGTFTKYVGSALVEEAIAIVIIEKLI